MTGKAPHSFRINLNNKEFLFRPLVAADKVLLKKGFSELSDQSKYFRFFAYQRELTETQLKYFTEVDGINHVAWGTLDESLQEPKGVAVGRFVRLVEEPEVAEVAFTVIDKYQQKGLGGILLSVMNILAGYHGIEVFRYYVLRENKFVLENLEAMGILSQSSENGIIKVDSKVCPDHESIPNVPRLQSFITAMKKVEALIF